MPSPQKQQEKSDLTDEELKQFGLNLWPPKIVEDPVELLKLLQWSFLQSGDDDDDDECKVERPSDVQWTVFSTYCRKVGGFSWINAVHDFGGGDMQTPLTLLCRSYNDEWRLLDFLLQMGMDPNVRNAKGEPPLYVFMSNQSLSRRYRFGNTLMEAGANDQAIYGGKAMYQWAKLFRDDDRVSQMIFEDFRKKFGD